MLARWSALLLAFVVACGRIGYEGRSNEGEPEAADDPVIAAEAEAPVPNDEPVPLEPCGDYPYGDGADGAFEVRFESTVRVNPAIVLEGGAAAGLSELSVVDFPEPLREGAALLFWQAQGPQVSARGETTPFDVDAPPGVGYYEVRRVASLEGDRAILCTPLSRGYGAGAQVVAVPQFSEVSITQESVLAARSWTGAAGGIVALMVQQTFRLEGQVSALAQGYRGAEYVNVSGEGCGPAFESAAGEGAGLGYNDGIGGSQNRGTGGGGADCNNDGGGGGGNAGMGGTGGLRDGLTPSMGGRSQTTSQAHLLLGGGGGAGAGDNSIGTSGAAGGGAVWIRAQAITGRGGIDASGGEPETAGGDGGGGGGSGGTIDTASDAFSIDCAMVRAAGGAGAAAGFGHGVGGGGGGGFVRIAVTAGAPEPCLPDVSGGPTGATGNPGTAGSAGVAQVSDGG